MRARRVLVPCLLSGVIALLVSACASTTRVSVGPAGDQGTGHSRSATMSSDGRYVAFESYSRLIEPDTVNSYDVFVRDRTESTTIVVSQRFDGTGTAGGTRPRISGNGRFVAFTSGGSAVVPGDTNGDTDVFVRDLSTGSTERVSVSSSEAQANDGSDWGSVSNDGRYVVFQSNATNLVSNDTNVRTDVFLRDRQSGTTTRLSMRVNGTEADELSGQPVISSDGSTIAFLSQDGLLVTDDPSALANAYVVTRATGAIVTGSCGVPCATTQQLASTIDLSANGRYLAFTSITRILRKDLLLGGLTEIALGTAQSAPAISDDGDAIAFASTAANLVPGDTNGRRDVFLHTVSTGSTSRVSVTSSGNQIETADSLFADVAGGSRFVTFETASGEVVSGDTNFTPDVFIRDSGG